MTEKGKELQATEVQIIYKSKIPASERVQVKNSSEAFKLFWDHWDPGTISHHETFKMLLLNNANFVLGLAELSIGGVTSTIVDPKIIFQYALKCHASAIIVAHNHPSGNCNPSESDIQITKKLVEGGKMLNIQVLDHIILSPDEKYNSLADEGKM